MKTKTIRYFNLTNKAGLGSARFVAIRSAVVSLSLIASLFALWPHAASAASGISSLSRNGELICTDLTPGTTATVEWAPSPTGPWTNSWNGLQAIPVNSDGKIQVSVPMFYRVRSVPTGMVMIPDGPFMMGDAFNDGDETELPVHTVYVSAFYMDTFEVTKALWDEVRIWADANGYDLGTSGDGKAPDHPVHSVTWYDALKWCNARSEMERRVPAYYADAAQTVVYRSGQISVENDWVNWNAGYRLPTEAEWEKAARGGASGRRFPWTDSDNISHSQANYSAWDLMDPYDLSYPEGHHPMFAVGGGPYTSPVGYFAPNGYGLHDMAGNVYEWCWDWHGAYSSDPQTDPRGPVSGLGPPSEWSRVIRGGCWGYSAGNCRVAVRGSYRPPNRVHWLGFRCVLPAPQP